MTPAQRAVFRELIRFREQSSIPPSLDELAASCGKGRSTVYEHLLALRKHGYVTWNDKQTRTLRIVRLPEGWYEGPGQEKRPYGGNAG